MIDDITTKWIRFRARINTSRINFRAREFVLMMMLLLLLNLAEWVPLNLVSLFKLLQYLSSKGKRFGPFTTSSQCNACETVYIQLDVADKRNFVSRFWASCVYVRLCVWIWLI